MFKSCVENAALGRTSRERWKLFKNISKLGLQRLPSIQDSNTADGGDGGEAAGGTATNASGSEVDLETDMKTISFENILAADDDDVDSYNTMMPAVCVFFLL